MPGDPTVIQVMNAFKAQLEARETAQFRLMAGHWLDVERALDAEISALARDFDARRANGESITQAALFRMNRYQSLLQQSRREIERFERIADTEITDGQRTMMRLGIEHAADAIRVQMPGVGTFFDRLPVEAVENMAGLAGDGSPLADLLAQAWPDSVEGITRSLLRGTALGWNPERTARAMRDSAGAGLQRALVISRTEQNRVYRETARQQYQASGVVTGYRRLAARSDNTCPACLMADGRFYPLNAPFEEHPQGRCTPVPQVDGMPPVRWQLGRDWFRAQDADTQRRILGPGRYEAYRAGRFDLDQLVARREDDTWGASLQVAPLSQLAS